MIPPPPDTPQGVDQDVVVVLHPDRPLVLTGDDVASGLVNAPVSDQPEWSQLLDAARRVVPDGTWPLGPDRRIPGTRLHVVEARSSAAVAGCRWVERPDPSWPAAVRAAVATLLDEDAGRTPVSPLRAAWMQRGWWTEATAWVDARLAGSGRRRTGDLEPKEYWAISAVARVPTTGGPLWLKAVPPMFAREPAVLRVLGERMPEQVPGVFALDAADTGTRFLLNDAGTVPDDVEESDPPRLAALIANLQLRCLDLLPRLAAAGCADRSPSNLASELTRMADEGVELDLLNADERAALRRLLPELKDGLLALSDGPLPTVLLHGDFHAWNVARPANWSIGDAVVIDWTDAAIGPAGVDLVTLLPESMDGQARAQVRHAYASAWATHLSAPLPDIEAAVAATVPAAHVVQAMAYDEILRAIEPETRWPLSGAMARHLRDLLTAP